MSTAGNTARPRPARRRALGFFALFVAALAVMLGLATSAGATTIVSTSPNGPYATGASVTVSGTGVAGHYVAVTECNSTLGGANGTFCNHTGSTAFAGVTIPASGNWSVTITVRKTFANWNYQTNSAGTGTTTCSGSTVCQIQASEYTSNPPTSAPVGTAGKTIAFT
jgi:hypothetical protein